MIWIIIPLVLLLLLYAAIGAVYYIAFYSPHRGQNDFYRLTGITEDPGEAGRMRELIRDLEGKPFEPVEITSSDGLTLRGRYYHAKDGAPLDIGFHGYRGTPVRDFSGGARLSFLWGHNLLLVEERAHGGSGGHSITMGIREKYDVLDWLEYAEGRFGTDVKILLYGVSMGAATVLMASGERLPRSVRGVVADSPYSSPLGILLKVATAEKKLPRKPAEWALRLAARLFGGFSLAEEGAVDAVKRAKIPILLIHGERDTFVPPQMSREIQAADPEKILLFTFPGARHGLSYITDPERYKKLVTGFMEMALRDPEPRDAEEKDDGAPQAGKETVL